MFPTGTPIDISSIPLKVSVTGVVCCLFILLFIFWSLYIHYDFSRILRKGHKPLFRQQELLVREVIADFPVHGLRLVRYGCAVFADQHVLQTVTETKVLYSPPVPRNSVSSLTKYSLSFHVIISNISSTSGNSRPQDRKQFAGIAPEHQEDTFHQA